MADQWRFSAFGHTLAAPVATPRIDRLAAESLRFERAYAANPLCAPSRASLMTGRFAHQHGVVANELTLPPKERGLAESFVDSGYATHYIGKWHLDGPDRPGFVRPGWRRRGFETFEGFNRGHYYDAPRTFSNEGELLRPKAFEATYQTDRAIAFLRENADRPFLCFLSWGPPHPATSTPRPDPRADTAEIAWRANVPRKMRRSGRLRSDVLHYYALCAALDREMGRLLDALDELELRENTLVVFTSDHGDMLGSHGLLAAPATNRNRRSQGPRRPG